MKNWACRSQLLPLVHLQRVYPRRDEHLSRTISWSNKALQGFALTYV